MKVLLLKRCMSLAVAVCISTMANDVYSKTNKPAGVVVSALGKAYKYELKNMKDKKRIAKNSDVKNQDWLKTEIESFVKVLLKDDTVFSLGENTHLQFKKYAYLTKSKRKAHYKLAKGKLRSIFTVKAETGAIKIETPDVTLNVEGTEILTNVYDGQTDIVLLSGKLRVDIDGKSVVLKPGEMFNSKKFRISGEKSILKISSTTMEHLHAHPRNFLPFVNTKEMNLFSSLNNNKTVLEIPTSLLEKSNITTALIKSSDFIDVKLDKVSQGIVGSYHKKVDKIETTATRTVSSVSSVASSATSSVAETVSPAAEVAAPVVEAVAPAVEVAAPVVEVAAPVVEIAAPVVEVAAPVVEVAAPVVEVAAPVIEVAAPVIEVAAPVVVIEQPAPAIVQPPTPAPTAMIETPVVEVETPEVPSIGL